MKNRAQKRSWRLARRSHVVRANQRRLRADSLKALFAAAGHPVGRRIKYRRNSVARRAVEAVVFRARLARA